MFANFMFCSYYLVSVTFFKLPHYHISFFKNYFCALEGRFENSVLSSLQKTKTEPDVSKKFLLFKSPTCNRKFTTEIENIIWGSKLRKPPKD